MRKGLPTSNVIAAWALAAAAFGALVTATWVQVDASEPQIQRPLKVRPIAPMTADRDG